MKKIIVSIIALVAITMSVSAQKKYVVIYDKEGNDLHYYSSDDVSKVDFTDTYHEYVDLGLSVKWATCNVGADSPEGYGDYYAWGETATKSEYEWTTYKLCNGSYSTLTKYCMISGYGTVDNKTTLEAADDVAYVKWGRSWRMPTETEFKELIDNCTWTWCDGSTTQYNGTTVKGYKVTSNKSGYTDKSIFLPAAGERDGGTLNNDDLHCEYWSSSLSTTASYNAMSLTFSDESNKYIMGGNSRCHGQSVRPVRAI